jgi:hypothetical protein
LRVGARSRGVHDAQDEAFESCVSHIGHKHGNFLVSKVPAQHNNVGSLCLNALEHAEQARRSGNDHPPASNGDPVHHVAVQIVLVARE